jgi:hypothetical protein
MEVSMVMTKNCRMQSIGYQEVLVPMIVVMPLIIAAVWAIWL